MRGFGHYLQSQRIVGERGLFESSDVEGPGLQLAARKPVEQSPCAGYQGSGADEGR